MTLPPCQARRCPTGLHLHIGNLDIHLAQRALRAPVGHDPQTLRARRGGQAHSALILPARHQQPTGHQAPGKLDENMFELLARMVAIQMIGLHVRHDLNSRGIVQERAIRLVGLGDEDVSAAQVRARAQLGQHAAHGHRRVQPARRQRDRQHARGRGLTVRPGHAHETHTRRRQSQRLGAVNHQLTARPCDRQLRVVLADRRRHHNYRCRVHMRGLVTNKDTHPDGAQVLEHGGILAVRSLHGRATRGQQLRDDAHAGTTDANQMETILKRRLTHGRPPSPVPKPDQPARGPLPHAPATATQPPYPPDASTPATGTRCGARTRR